MGQININLPPLTQQQIERFWKFIDKTPGQGPQGECWEWQGSKCRKYGIFTIRDERQANRKKRRNLRAHRIVHYLLTDQWSPLLLCHKCDNPPCCNPAHLFEGTQSDNMQDAKRKGRAYKAYKPAKPPKQKRLRLNVPRPTRKPTPTRYSLSNFTPNPSPRLWGVGEQHAFSKLTRESVLSIRAEYSNGTSGADLARKYNVHRASIRDVVLRRSWNHV